MPPLPPAPIVRAVEGMRSGLQKLTRRLAPAPFSLLELIQGSMVTQAIYAAAELDVAEVLKDGPLAPGEIARKVGADTGALYRLLRLLSTYDIFAEQKDGRFALTPMAKALRKDSPMSMHGIAVLMGHPTHWEEWAHLVDSVRTGEPSLPKLRGMGAFEYLEANAAYGEIFIKGMGAMSATETDPILAAYDFSKYETVVDFCGGRGDLLAGILNKAKGVRGILSDPRVADNGAAAFLAEQGVSDRCTIADGGLFDPMPAGADAYVLKHIVHDWPESQALEILKNAREAIRPDGRLLLMEMVPNDKRNAPHAGKQVDLWLMLLVGGMERTQAQYGELLSAAGFRLERIVQTPSAVSIVEASPR